MIKNTIIAAVGLTAFLTPIHAEDLFRLDATNMPGGGAVMGSISTDDLFNDILGDDSSFELFDMSTDVDYTLSYAGVAGLVTYKVDPSIGGVTGVLGSRLAGINQTFIGLTRDDVDDQMEEFLENGGWDKILQAAQKHSLVAITDGNPSSTTALLANQAFDSGLNATDPRKSSNEFGISLMADFKTFKAGDFEGTSYQLPLSFRIPIGSKYYGDLRIPLAYTKIGDAKAYHGGLHLTVPIAVYTDDTKVWVLSPSVGAAASFSEELVSGAALWTAGLTSTFRWDFGSFAVTMGNHYSMYEGIDIEVDDYKIGGDLSQAIVKNGLKVSIPIASGNWEVESYAIHTAFLDDAAVEDYVTVGLQLSTGAGSDSNGRLTIRLEGEYGDDYDSLGLKFGGGFKF